MGWVGCLRRARWAVPAAPSQLRAKPETQVRRARGSYLLQNERGGGWHLRHLRWRQLARWLCQAPCQLTGASLISHLEKSYLCCSCPDQSSPCPGASASEI